MKSAIATLEIYDDSEVKRTLLINDFVRPQLKFEIMIINLKGGWEVKVKKSVILLRNGSVFGLQSLKVGSHIERSVATYGWQLRSN